eukprot:comp21545_c0_seq1/m.30019 comp21545_c0_seq1/g.30019  ORF comp21545_c0_seq1/g.30019 comp21545_c0_seq1/m.30019 type:complete len:588 (-) comp21545_c0_seq1:165-1928(-)
MVKKKGGPPAKTGKKQAEAVGFELDDELDTFTKSRQKIMLEDGEGSSGESEEEAVFDLPEQDSDEESDEDEDDFNEDEFNGEDGEGEEEDEEEGDEIDEKAWGSKKSAFYGTDYVDEELGDDYHSDMEDAELEEKELERMQKKQAAAFDDSDFMSTEATLFQKPKQKKQKEEEVTVESDDEVEREVIARDVSTLTDTEKLELIVKDSPELLGLVEDMKEKMAYMRNTIMPLIAAAEGNTFSREGLSYLKTKQQLVMRYCLNVSFYLALRATGPVPRDHPVIGQLVSVRQLMEKMQPIDDMVTSQIQDMGGESDDSEDESDDDLTSQMEGLDSDNQSEEEEDDDMQIDSKTHNGKTKAPRKPAFSIKPEKLQHEATEYKAVKKTKWKENTKQSKQLIAADDFGEVELENPKPEGGKKKKSVWAKNAPKKQREAESAETDVPRRERDGVRERRDAVVFDDDDDGDYQELPAGKRSRDTGDDDLYEQVAAAKKKRKLERELAHKKVASYLPEEEAENKRGINWQMSKNKGLTPRRKSNNPRVKHKMKFDKAVKKRKTVVRQVVPGQAGAVYGGEGTGIKKKLVKSVKIKA